MERIADGEVSTYLHDVLMPGDQLEVRGPIARYFVWEVALGGPLVLIGGGSGVVPLMAMLRHRAAQESTVPARLLYSSRTAEDVIYRDELDQLADRDSGLEVFFTFTRGGSGWLDRLSAPNRRDHVGRGRETLWNVRSDLRVRTHVAGGERRQWVGPDGLQDRPDPDRTLRTDRTLRRHHDG